jgi:hypothetical protein
MNEQTMREFDLTDFTLHENATHKWLYGKWEIECYTGDIYFGTWRIDSRYGQYIDNGVQIIWFQDTTMLGEKCAQIHRQLSDLIEINANKGLSIVQ